MFWKSLGFGYDPNPQRKELKVGSKVEADPQNQRTISFPVARKNCQQCSLKKRNNGMPKKGVIF